MSGEIDEPWVRLELTSRPEAARIVRSMASAAGDALGFDPELLADVNTAVTEACNNVILHAYGDGQGRCPSSSASVGPESRRASGTTAAGFARRFPSKTG